MQIRAKSLIFVQSIIGTVLGIYYWRQVSKMYWKKDLGLPIDHYALLGICILAGSLTFCLVSALVIMATRRIQVLSKVATEITTATGLVCTNLLVHTLFNLLGVDSRIYFISDNGLRHLLLDSTLLFVVGIFVGASISWLTRTFRVRYEPELP